MTIKTRVGFSLHIGNAKAGTRRLVVVSRQGLALGGGSELKPRGEVTEHSDGSFSVKLHTDDAALFTKMAAESGSSIRSLTFTEGQPWKDEPKSAAAPA